MAIVRELARGRLQMPTTLAFELDGDRMRVHVINLRLVPVDAFHSKSESPHNIRGSPLTPSRAV